MSTLTALAAPAAPAQADAWEAARAAWLAAKRAKSGSAHTARAYALDYAAFFAFVGKPPWLVTSADAAAWLRHLSAAGSAPATVNRRLAALSSFYAFILAQEGPPAGASDNPFQRPPRAPVTAYATARPLSADAVRACLQRINRRTQTGARDYALIMAYVFTGRRSAELAHLRWGDLAADSTRCRYTWIGRGGVCRTDELPLPVWHALRAYLHTAGRLASIQPHEYIFRPLFPARAARLPNVQPGDPNRPLSSAMILRIVKRRFACVGINPAAVGTHTLRHTAAALRCANGEGQDVAALSALLGHSCVAVTQALLAHWAQPIDTGWTAVAQTLAL